MEKEGGDELVTGGGGDGGNKDTLCDICLFLTLVTSSSAVSPRVLFMGPTAHFSMYNLVEDNDHELVCREVVWSLEDIVLLLLDLLLLLLRLLLLVLFQIKLYFLSMRSLLYLI